MVASTESDKCAASNSTGSRIARTLAKSESSGSTMLHGPTSWSNGVCLKPLDLSYVTNSSLSICVSSGFILGYRFFFALVLN